MVTASLVSAYPIIGVDLHKEKIELGKQFGLTYGLIGNANEFKNELKKILNDKEPEVVFETTGNSKVMEKAYELTPNDGKTIFVGVPNDKISIYSLPLAFNKILKVSHGGNSNLIKIFPDISILLIIKKLILITL